MRLKGNEQEGGSGGGGKRGVGNRCSRVFYIVARTLGFLLSEGRKPLKGFKQGRGPFRRVTVTLRSRDSRETSEEKAAKT